MYERKLPIYLLFLDAKSAFDRVVTPYLVRKLYMPGMVGSSLLSYIEYFSASVTSKEASSWLVLFP